LGLKKLRESSNMHVWKVPEYTARTMATKHDSSTVLAPERAKTKPPRMYKVILFNDDYTTMDFVIEVLQRFFSMNRERALQIMLKVHNEGSAVCGVYSQDVAETKVTQVTEFAQQHGHPLRCGMEEN
jgi:ATP-dependent Clp protease adaptor protein ClpS